MPTSRLTTGADTVIGTSGADIVEVPSNNANFTEADTITAGAGLDTMIFERAPALSVGSAKFANTTGIDVLDVTASSAVTLIFDNSVLDQSDSGTVEIRFDGDPLALDLRTISAAQAGYVVNGTGTVTLYDVLEQVVTVADGVNGTIEGGANRDILLGGTGNDTLTGNAGEDSLSGGAGNDSLVGGAGYDLIAGGAGTNTLTGGAESDTFVIAPGSTDTITDFDATDPFERIDLRAFSGISGFGDLTLAQSGNDVVVTVNNSTSVRLSNVQLAQLDASDFVFSGDTVETLAQGLGPAAGFRFTDAADSFTGGAGTDIFEIIGNYNKLSSADTFDGGAGTDVLRVWGDTRTVSSAKVSGMTSVEVIDMSGSTGSPAAVIDAAMVAQSDTNSLLIKTGANTLFLDTETAGDADAVVVEGTGLVTLVNSDGQSVTLSDAYGGQVQGGGRDDEIEGGAKDDQLLGGARHDVINGNGGDDTINGEEGADTISGGAGSNTVTGGADTDRFIVTSGETLTITDFDVSDTFERIDMRAFAGLRFSDLNITNNGGNARVTGIPGGTTLTLNGVSAGALSAGDFLFDNEADSLYFYLSDGVDVINGGAGDDIIDLLGNIAQLDASDSIDGGAGIDTLRVFGADREVSPERLSALTSVEVIDFSQATGNSAVTITADLVASSGPGTITVRHGDTSLLIDTAELDADQVIVEGAGAVTLRNTNDQGVTISNAVGGDVTGSGRADEIIGGNRGDSISGGEGRDTLDGGAGNDTLRGGDHPDLLITGAGNDVLTGGGDYDSFKISANNSSTTITDFSPLNFLERIDLTEFTGMSGMGALTITDTASGAQVTGGSLDLLIEGVSASELDADNFLFAGQDPTVFHVENTTEISRLQALLNDAPAGSTIYLEAGTYEVTETLYITRSDISLIGAGEGETVFVTMIPDDEASPTLFVQNDDPLSIDVGGAGGIAQDAVEGTRTVVLNAGHGLGVGDLLYITQPNDAEYLAATGNTGWEEPEATPETEGRTYLREQHSRIVAIDGNTVTLAEPLAYTFEADAAIVQQDNFLENVYLTGFTIEGRWGEPDPFFFDTTMPAWESIAALELDGVENSTIEAVTVLNPAAHAFSFQRNYNVTADDLQAEGAHNKLGASGYHFYLQESFANTFTNLTSIDARHAVLTSSFSAEHYNSVHMLFSNRDINFHGSPDSDNTIVVDRLVMDYPAGSDRQWAAVQPGVFPEHPYSTIEDNDVTFRYARAGERDDTIHAHNDGGYIDGGAGGDQIYGGDGNDTLVGNVGRDTIEGGAGRDRFIRDIDDDNDIINDFETGTGGDIFVIRNTAYSAFGELDLTQVGNDVFLDFGPLGNTTFLNTRVGAFTAANFVFEPGGDGRNIVMRASELFGVGTQGDDTFGISRSHLTTAHEIVAGAGFDTLQIRVTSFYGNLSDFGTYSGIDAIDATLLEGNTLTIDQRLTGQSDNNVLTLYVGDLDRPFNLDVSGVPSSHRVLIDGTREVQLTGGGSHTVFGANTGALNLIGDTGNDSIIGTPFEDSIDGGAGRDTIKSGDGDDTIDGGAGNDAMYGGAGSDTYYVDHGSDKIYDSNQWAGTDQVFSSVTFYLGKPHLENLTLTGSANIRGFGNGLDNVLRGNSGDNRLYGNSGDDVIYGGAGNDTVEGWYGDDTLYGGAGNDRFLGGPGSDVYYITDAGDTVNESRWAGRDTIYSQVDFALGQAGHIENLVLQGTAITGRGNGLDNRIEGNAQDNVLTGNKGQDTLIGGAGDDTLNGEAGGGDLAIGGAGSDTYIVNHSKDIVVEEASDAGVDHVMSSAVFRLEGSHVENLTLLSNRNISGFGNELDNVITGNSGSNQLDGGAGGADTLIGGGANDIFHVRSIDDVVIEEAGTGTGVADAVWAYVDIARLADNVENVVIRGNGALDANGNGLDNMVIGNNAVNVLDGLGGNDTLRGNGGPDQFVFSTAPGSGNVDHIVDFTHRGDTIMLSTGVFNNSTAGALAADAFVNGTAALDANDRVLYDQASGRLWYDANGSAAGGKVLFAVLGNTPTLDADDFAFF